MTRWMVYTYRMTKQHLNSRNINIFFTYHLISDSAKNVHHQNVQCETNVQCDLECTLLREPVHQSAPMLKVKVLDF